MDADYPQIWVIIARRFTPYHKTQRTGHSYTHDDAPKLHLRLLKIGSQTLRVVTLRPRTDALYSTNYFHNTWHIISDQAGSRLLGRLLWGLSFQRQPGTLIVLHGKNLHPTPFDAASSDPIVLAPAHLSPLRQDTLRALKERLPRLNSPTQTIRWQTFGLDLASGDRDGYFASNEMQSLWQQEKVRHCGGCLYYTAPPVILRLRAKEIFELHTTSNSDDICFLADGTRTGPWYPDGEVQIIENYRNKLRLAQEARKQVLKTIERNVPPETTRQAIYHRMETIQKVRADARRKHLP